MDGLSSLQTQPLNLFQGTPEVEIFAKIFQNQSDEDFFNLSLQNLKNISAMDPASQKLSFSNAGVISAENPGMGLYRTLAPKFGAESRHTPNVYAFCQALENFVNNNQHHYHDFKQIQSYLPNAISNLTNLRSRYEAENNPIKNKDNILALNASIEKLKNIETKMLSLIEDFDRYAKGGETDILKTMHKTHEQFSIGLGREDLSAADEILGSIIDRVKKYEEESNQTVAQGNIKVSQLQALIADLAAQNKADEEGMALLHQKLQESQSQLNEQTNQQMTTLQETTSQNRNHINEESHQKINGIEQELQNLGNEDQFLEHKFSDIYRGDLKESDITEMYREEKENFLKTPEGKVALQEFKEKILEFSNKKLDFQEEREAKIKEIENEAASKEKEIKESSSSQTQRLETAFNQEKLTKTQAIESRNNEIKNISQQLQETEVHTRTKIEDLSKKVISDITTISNSSPISGFTEVLHPELEVVEKENKMDRQWITHASDFTKFYENAQKDDDLKLKSAISTLKAIASRQPNERLTGHENGTLSFEIGGYGRKIQIGNPETNINNLSTFFNWLSQRCQTDLPYKERNEILALLNDVQKELVSMNKDYKTSTMHTEVIDYSIGICNRIKEMLTEKSVIGELSQDSNNLIQIVNLNDTLKLLMTSLRTHTSEEANFNELGYQIKSMGLFENPHLTFRESDSTLSTLYKSLRSNKNLTNLQKESILAESMVRYAHLTKEMETTSEYIRINNELLIQEKDAREIEALTRQIEIESKKLTILSQELSTFTTKLGTLNHNLGSKVSTSPSLLRQATLALVNDFLPLAAKMAEDEKLEWKYTGKVRDVELVEGYRQYVTNQTRNLATAIFNNLPEQKVLLDPAKLFMKGDVVGGALNLVSNVTKISIDKFKDFAPDYKEHLDYVQVQVLKEVATQKVAEAQQKIFQAEERLNAAKAYEKEIVISGDSPTEEKMKKFHAGEAVKAAEELLKSTKEIFAKAQAEEKAANEALKKIVQG